LPIHLLQQPVQVANPIEDAPRFDPAFENIREQFLDVRPSWGGTTGDGDVIEESW
jgi:hypothetical protein